MEGCRSGRTGRTRNAVCAQAYPGFESLPLRGGWLTILIPLVMKRINKQLTITIKDELTEFLLYTAPNGEIAELHEKSVSAILAHTAKGYAG